jgi:hypothetical protein
MWDSQHLTALQAPAVYYGDNFAFSCVDDVRTSQETRLWTSAAPYGDNLDFLHVLQAGISKEVMQEIL